MPQDIGTKYDLDPSCTIARPSGRAVLEEFPDRGIDIRSGAVNIVQGDPEGSGDKRSPSACTVNRTRSSGHIGETDGFDRLLRTAL